MDCIVKRLAMQELVAHVVGPHMGMDDASLEALLLNKRLDVIFEGVN